MKQLLDSSAVLAFYFGEPGAERVRDILSDERTPVVLSALMAAELWSRLRAEGAEERFEDGWRHLSELASAVLPVSLPVVLGSIALRRAATACLPHIDALIAATAAEHGAVLVHRDPHFSNIPADVLKQERLPDK